MFVCQIYANLEFQISFVSNYIENDFILFFSFLFCRHEVSTTNAEKQRDDLVGWWKFDEGSGESVFDSTGHVSKGKLVGAKWWMAPNLIGKILSSASLRALFSLP